MQISLLVSVYGRRSFQNICLKMAQVLLSVETDCGDLETKVLTDPFVASIHLVLSIIKDCTKMIYANRSFSLFLGIRNALAVKKSKFCYYWLPSLVNVLNFNCCFCV